MSFTKEFYLGFECGILLAVVVVGIIALIYGIIWSMKTDKKIKQLNSVYKLNEIYYSS
jgi:hypothetical protein